MSLSIVIIPPGISDMASHPNKFKPVWNGNVTVDSPRWFASVLDPSSLGSFCMYRSLEYIFITSLKVTAKCSW